MAEPKKEAGVLAAGGLAAVLATVCCFGPLLLVSLGLGGAWLSSLRVFEPFRPLFIGAALVALFFAYRRIWRPAAECQPGEICALPEVQRTYKFIFWGVATLVLIALTSPYLAPLFY
jgi:mercuric ion transport protein